MEIWEINVLYDHWADTPPTNELMFAAWFSKKEKTSPAPSPEQLQALGFQYSQKKRPKIQPITFDIPGFKKHA